MTGAATAEVERLIESRLREIEEQLRPFTELERERSRLQDALVVLRGGAAPKPDERAAAQGGRAARRSRSGRRAARGANLSAIIAHVTAQPGATAGDIADATGISRGVVYSATSRLSSAGKLERVPKPDGQVGYRAAGG